MPKNDGKEKQQPENNVNIEPQMTGPEEQAANAVFSIYINALFEKYFAYYDANKDSLDWTLLGASVREDDTERSLLEGSGRAMILNTESLKESVEGYKEFIEIEPERAISIPDYREHLNQDRDDIYNFSKNTVHDERVIRAVSARLKNMNSSHRDYAMLSSWADYMALNKMVKDGSQAAVKLAELNNRLNGLSEEERGDVLNQMSELRSNVDLAMRQRLSFLSIKVNNIGKAIGLDSDEFTTFRVALQNAANGGDLNELKEAAANYVRLKNPHTQDGKDRLAIANQVIRFLEIAEPVREDINLVLDAASERSMDQRVVEQEQSVKQEELVAEQPQPVAEQPQPVVEQPQPEIQQPQPIVEQVEMQQPQPVAEQPQPEIQQPQPEIQQNQPVEDLVEEYTKAASDARDIMPRSFGRRRNNARRVYEAAEERIQKMIDEGETEKIVKACTDIMIEKILWQEDTGHLRLHPDEARVFHDEAQKRIRERFFADDYNIDYAGYFMDLPEMSAYEIRREIGMMPAVKEEAKEEKVSRAEDAVQIPEDEFSEPEEEVIDPNTLTAVQKELLELQDSGDITREQFLKTASKLIASEIILQKLGPDFSDGEVIQQHLSRKIYESLDNNRDLYTMRGLRDYFVYEGEGKMSRIERLDKGLQKVAGEFSPKKDYAEEIRKNTENAELRIGEILKRNPRTAVNAYVKFNNDTTYKQYVINECTNLLLGRALTEEQKNLFRVDEDAARKEIELTRKQISQMFFPEGQALDYDLLSDSLNRTGDSIRASIQNADIVFQMEKKAQQTGAFLHSMMDEDRWNTVDGVRKLINSADEERVLSECVELMIYRALPAEKADELRLDAAAAEVYRDDTRELIHRRLIKGRPLDKAMLTELMSMDGESIRYSINAYDLINSERLDAGRYLHANTLTRNEDEWLLREKEEISRFKREFAENKDKIVDACVARMTGEAMPRELMYRVDSEPNEGLPFYREVSKQIREKFFPEDKAVEFDYVKKLVRMSGKSIFNELSLPEDIIKDYKLKPPADPHEVKLDSLLSPETSQKDFVNGIVDSIVNKRLTEIYGPLDDPKYAPKEAEDEAAGAENSAEEQISLSEAGTTDFGHLRSQLKKNLLSSLMDVPYDKLRECFALKDGEEIDSIDRLDRGLCRISEEYTKGSDFTVTIKEQARAARESLKGPLNSAIYTGESNWDAKTADKIVEGCTSIMIAKLLPENENEYNHLRVDMDMARAFYDAAKANITSSFFASGKRLDADYVGNLMNMSADEIKEKLIVSRREAHTREQENKFFTEKITMKGLQERGAKMLRNRNAASWEIRQAVADYMMFTTFMRKRSQAAPDSLYKQTKSIQAPLNQELFKEARTELMNSPAFKKVCENPKRLQQQIGRMPYGTLMVTLLDRFNEAEKELNPQSRDVFASQPQEPEAANVLAAAKVDPRVAENARKASEKANDVLRPFSINPAFKERLETLLNVKMKPRDEILLHTVVNKVDNGMKMGTMLADWVNDAYSKKDTGGDPETVKKVNDGVRHIAQKGYQYFQENAGNCDRAMQDFRSAGDEELISHWSGISRVYKTYSVVFENPKDMPPDEKCRRNIESIIRTGKELEKRMIDLSRSAKLEKVKQSDKQPGLS